MVHPSFSAILGGRPLPGEADLQRFGPIRPPSCTPPLVRSPPLVPCSKEEEHAHHEESNLRLRGWTDVQEAWPEDVTETSHEE